MNVKYIYRGNWAKFNVPRVIILLCVLPRISVQELSKLSESTGDLPMSQTGSESIHKPHVFPTSDAGNANVRSTLNRLKQPLGAADNVSLNALAENIGRLESNLASLIQSFLALQRSVFNLEQLQELLVLLLEDILKQTGNMDKRAKDADPPAGSSSVSDGRQDDDDGVDSAEIDETGEDTGDGDGDGTDNGRHNNKGDRATGDEGDGVDGSTNKGQDGTDPFNNAPNAGLLHEANSRYPADGTRVVSNNQKPQGRRFVNRVSDDSDEGSSEVATSKSTDDDHDDDDGERNAAAGATNFIAPKSVSSFNKVGPASPRQPQLSEPMMSLSAQLESRLNDMIRRLNPAAIAHDSPQRLAQIRAMPEELRRTHLGESPLAPRPIFEPLEILRSGNANQAPISKGAVPFRSLGVKVVQRIPVVSHGGPLVGPEDFSSPFMEKLDTMSGRESANERSTGMINNLMQMERVVPSTDQAARSDHKGQTSKETTTPTSPASPESQAPLTKTTASTAMATTTSDDFDQMIATLLLDLGDHLRKQRVFHEEQSKTSDAIDRAVIQLSKLTWIQKPAQNESSAFPGYRVHMAVNDVPPHSLDPGLDDDSQTTIPVETGSDAEGSQGDSPKVKEDSQIVAMNRILSTHSPTQQPRVTANKTTISPARNDHTSSPIPRYSYKGSQLEKNIPGPWDWLGYFKQSNVDSDIPLVMLIELLSELSSEEHNTSDELAMFSDRGQKLVKNKIHTDNRKAEMSQNSDGTDNDDDSDMDESEKPNDSEGSHSKENSSSVEVDDMLGSEKDDSSEDKDSMQMEEMTDPKELFDHMNSILGKTAISNDYSNSETGVNDTDSSSSENTSIDNHSKESDEDDTDDVDDDIVDDDDDDDNANDSDEYNSSSHRDHRQETQNGGEKGDNPHQNNAPLRLASTKPTEESYVNSEITAINGGINTIMDSKFVKKNSDTDPKTDITNRDNIAIQNNDIMHEDDEGSSESKQSNSEENEMYNDDNNPENYAYPDNQDKRLETQFYDTPYLDDPSGATSLLVDGNHFRAKRNIKRALRIFQHPQIKRKKRQVDAFWQQFLGQGFNPIGQEQGFLTNQRPSSGMQSQVNPQVHSGFQGQELFQDPLGQQHNLQNDFHQTAFQTPDQQNQNRQFQGQGLNQYPIPPFRPYPHYSRYNSYLGFNHPNFGYPGYPGMNHEPGESPSFETGLSADVMEEVLNSLFQRYWENVRNMFTTKGPSTTPENEYEGPLTTTTTTTIATTPTTQTTTTKAATTTQALLTKPPTTFQSLFNVTTSIITPSVNETNSTINATTTDNTTNSHTAEVGQGTSFISKPIDPTVHILTKTVTDKATSPPPNFFQRTLLMKTSPFPFF